MTTSPEVAGQYVGPWGSCAAPPRATYRPTGLPNLRALDPALGLVRVGDAIVMCDLDRLSG